MRDFLRIRRAETAGDYEQCAEVWLAGSLASHDFVDEWFWRGHRGSMAEVYLPGTLVLMAFLEDAQELAGFAALAGRRVEALFVRPDLWGRGVGRGILARLFELEDHLTLNVYRKNERAVAFYKRQGFVVTGEGYCPHTGEEELAMAWDSQPSVGDRE